AYIIILTHIIHDRAVGRAHLNADTSIAAYEVVERQRLSNGANRDPIPSRIDNLAARNGGAAVPDVVARALQDDAVQPRVPDGDCVEVDLCRVPYLDAGEVGALPFEQSSGHGHLALTTDCDKSRSSRVRGGLNRPIQHQ